jgi:hypothetical protein
MIGPILKSQEIQEESFFLDFLTLEDETDRLHRNIGKELPLYAALYPRGAQISSTSRWKSEMKQIKHKSEFQLYLPVSLLSFILAYHSVLFS